MRALDATCSVGGALYTGGDYITCIRATEQLQAAGVACWRGAHQCYQLLNICWTTGTSIVPMCPSYLQLLFDL